WLTEATAASSEVDIGEGLRANFDPKAKWKSAIFKVRINNSLAKLNRSFEVPVKDGRTTSDEEDSDDDDEVSIFSVRKKDTSQNPTSASAGSTFSKSAAEDSAQEEEAKEKEPEKAKEAVATPASPPPSAAVPPQANTNGVTPTGTPQRPGAHPSQQQHHHLHHQGHHDDDSDDEGPSMPGSFHFGSPKKGSRAITPEGRSSVDVISEKLRGLGWK
ncbi:hypothetical protein FRC01_011420, partial [Tulasnella sp. 417]